MTAGLVLALGGVGLGILPRTVSAFVPAMTMGLVGLVESQMLTRMRLSGGKVRAFLSAFVSNAVGVGVMVALIYLT